MAGSPLPCTWFPGINIVGNARPHIYRYSVQCCILVLLQYIFEDFPSHVVLRDLTGWLLVKRKYLKHKCTVRVVTNLFFFRLYLSLCLAAFYICLTLSCLFRVFSYCMPSSPVASQRNGVHSSRLALQSERHSTVHMQCRVLSERSWPSCVSRGRDMDRWRPDLCWYAFDIILMECIECNGRVILVTWVEVKVDVSLI